MTRNLFLALVLANLAFAAWHAWFAPAAGMTRSMDPGTPSIVLASEFVRDQFPVTSEPTTTDTDEAPPDESAAGAREAAVTAAAVVTTEPPEGSNNPGVSASSCISIGPFRELAQAANAAVTLRGEGFAPVQRAGEGDIWVGYWVRLAGISTRQEANDTLAVLRDKGMTEPYVIGNSGEGFVISLGIFTEVARAGRQLNEVRELGFEPTVVDRTRRGTVYWVDVLVDANHTLDFDLLQPPGRIMRLEQRPCQIVAP
jgi:SPOR domain